MARFMLQTLVMYLTVTAVNAFFTVPVSVGLGSALYQALRCRFTECSCQDKLNIKGLYYDLNARLFGQHLVTDIVFKAVTRHATDTDPKKALTLSFNGCPGCGKTFVSKLVAENLFRRGMDSEYVNLIIAPLHFPHKEKLEVYKTLLTNWVIGNITKCPRSLFIFDEIDGMPQGLVDVLKPFLQHNPDVKEVDSRKSMFIFISRAGTDLIHAEVYKHCWKQAKCRNEITLKQLDHAINRHASEEQMDVWLPGLIADYFVPFLPLEREHVNMCIEVALKNVNHPIDADGGLVVDIADKVLNFPEWRLYSALGCKLVPSKISLLYDNEV